MGVTFNKRQPHHWAPVREERNRLLAITDLYMFPDRTTQDQRVELEVYRAALRDITLQTPAANQVVWPIAPAFIKELNE